MIEIIKEELKNILIASGVLESNITIGDYENWKESGEKSALIEWRRTETVKRTISISANVVYVDVYYAEAVPKDKNKEIYLENLQGIISLISDSNNFSKELVNMNIDTNKLDRTLDNNNNFISRISISGQYHL